MNEEEQKLMASNVSSTATIPQNNPENLRVAEDFIALSNFQLKMSNNLLGKFDFKGKYSISDEAILLALKEIPKKFEEKDENVVYASVVLDQFVLNFKIVFDYSSVFAKASLYFIEIERGLEDDVKHVSLVDEIEDVNSEKFKEEVYKQWKVYFEEEIYDKDDYLLNLLRSQAAQYDASYELLQILAQLYVMRMLAALDNCGELGQEIKAEYNQMLDKLIQIDPSITQDDVRLKLLLDSIIKKHNALNDIVATQEGLAVISGYINPMKRVFNPPSIVQQNSSTKIETKKEEKKSENKPVKSKPKAKAKAKAKVKKASPVKAFDMTKVFKVAKKKEEEKKKPLAPPKKTDTKQVVPPAQKPVQPTPPKNLNDDWAEILMVADQITEAANQKIINSNKKDGGMVKNDIQKSEKILDR